VHDCILDTVPIFCFSYHGPHGHSELHNSTLADSRCSDTAASRGIQFVLGVMLVAVNRGSPPVHLDSRCGGQSLQAACAQLWAVFAWLAVSSSASFTLASKSALPLMQHSIVLIRQACARVTG